MLAGYVIVGPRPCNRREAQPYKTMCHNIYTKGRIAFLIYIYIYIYIYNIITKWLFPFCLINEEASTLACNWKLKNSQLWLST